MPMNQHFRQQWREAGLKWDAGSAAVVPPPPPGFPKNSKLNFEVRVRKIVRGGAALVQQQMEQQQQQQQQQMQQAPQQ